MALIESGKFVASSKDNFIAFTTGNENRPYVTFQFTGNPAKGTLTIADGLNDDGYKKTIVYDSTDHTIVISDNSFVYVPGQVTANTFSLLECLKMNTLFYDVQIVTTSGNLTIKAYIDSSTRYRITDTGAITVGGTYTSWTPKTPDKYVLLENTNEGQITMEKYTVSNTISFNITAPFEHLTFKDPKQMKVMGYKISNNNVELLSISSSEFAVFPTTLSKFSKTILFPYYFNGGSAPVNFLTNNFVRDYNYGEMCGLSVLTDKSMTLVKKYYTVSGLFLGQDGDYLQYDNNYFRRDIYFKLNIDGIEAQTNKKVGYVEVSCNYNGSPATNPIRYNVVARCNDNNEIFFVNELGGIDSFNFLGERVYNSKIDDMTTYFINPTMPWSRTKEMETIATKKNKVEHTLKTTIVGADTAKWLNELQKSKYQFLYFDELPTKFVKIIVDDMDIEVSDRENTYEIELTYRDGDNDVLL